MQKLRALINTACAQRLASDFILSRVDYCNTVLAGLSSSTLAPLQQVLNPAARFVVEAISHTHGSGIMKSLHWLPIAYRIRFKLCVLMHRVRNGTSPSYLTDTKTLISSLPGHCQLHSAMTTEYDIPCTRTKFGETAFSVAGPCEWNALPADTRSITNLLSFKTSHQDILFRIGIFGLNSFTFTNCTMFRASGQFWGV